MELSEDALSLSRKPSAAGGYLGTEIRAGKMTRSGAWKLVLAVQGLRHTQGPL